MLFRFFIVGAFFVLVACAPKSELDEAKREIQRLETENSGLKRMLAEKSKLQDEIIQKNQKLEFDNSELRERMSKKPELPVKMVIRKALLGSGYVAVFDTTVKKQVSVLATVKSKSLGTLKKFELHINPNVATELGYGQGATLENGDTLILENVDYAPVTYTVNSE